MNRITPSKLALGHLSLPIVRSVRLLFLVLFTTASVLAQPLSKLELTLEKVYRTNPGLVTQFNPEILQKEIRKILKAKGPTDELVDVVRDDLAAFLSSRERVIQNIHKHPNLSLPRVVVSGQSISGMVAAAKAAQSGHKVNVYDLRMTYTRNIQFSTRQAVVDTLASIDPKLAEKFLREVGTNLVNGYIEIQPTGEVTNYGSSALTSGDPRRIPRSGAEMLKDPVDSVVQTKVFEKLLFEYLRTHPNVVQTKGKIEIGPVDPKTNRHKVTEYADVTPPGQKEKVYRKLTEGYPITLIAEGGSSASREALKIENVPVSKKRLQVAGEVEIEASGEIVTHFRTEAPGRMVTGSMGTTGSNRRWVVGDVDEARITPDARKFGADPSTPEFKAERARLLEIEFKRIAALNMRKPISEVEKLKVNGAIEGFPLQTFDFQARLSRKAASAGNVLLMADAVGNFHWSVGGGMHVGTVNHPERFIQYLTAINAGTRPEVAAAEYSTGALEDTMAWGTRSLYFIQDNLPPKEAGRAFKEAVQMYFDGKVPTPEKALELLLPEGRKSLRVMEVKFDCKEGIQHFLDSKTP